MYTMMLVDDDYISREGLRDLIDWDRLGIEITGEAEDGAEALLVARDLTPDIVITDVVMPVMDGIQFVDKLKQEQPAVMIIMISAHQDIHYVKASIKLDAIDYILKPFNREELKQVVGKVVAKLDKERAEKRLKDDVSQYYSGSISSTGLPVIVESVEKIIGLCSTGQTEALTTEVQQLFLTIRRLKMESMLFLTTICSELLIKAIRSAATHIDSAIAQEVKESLHQFRTMQSPQQIEMFVIEKMTYLEMASNELRNSKSRRIIREVEDIIRRMYDQNLTIGQLAGEVFMSPGHLQTLFKKEMGQTINDYITQVRLEKAQLLLKDASIKIYEVANQVGYQDTYYFTKIFKKVVGVNPMEYRENTR
ncbi:response regulator [Paenibacillus qinlingensis]|uniref:Two-component system response regulator YesN n=1 Tax=Paenibacillus qinlingensis TaxID=1837343 RepID=A0ABU1NSX4_9BACL|nr:response regulator [Paenibacillus qinlingensis]MDR6550576.1 two-component system response regulator YesN [Paenibacillus qinlingensis]